jgi:hypothetical protein
MKNLRISKKFLAIVTACLSLSVFSCKDELSNLDNLPSGGVSKDVSVEEQDRARIEVAKILAKSLAANVELRKYMKTEAMKRFDNDSDIFWAKSKNDLVDGQKTFRQILNETSSSIDITTGKLPLLNFLIPELKNKSIIDWNIESEIPFVAVLGSKQLKNDNKLISAYDSEGNEHILDAFKHPNQIMIVVEDSERIEMTGNSKNGREKIEQDWIPCLQSTEVQYFYRSDSYVNKSKSSRIDNWVDKVQYSGNLSTNQYIDINDITAVFGPSTNQSFNISSFDDQFNRVPEIYVNLFLPSKSNRQAIYFKKNGDFNNQVKDRIEYVRLADQGQANYVSESWTEGNLEFEITRILGGKTTSEFNGLTTIKSVETNYSYNGASPHFNWNNGYWQGIQDFFNSVNNGQVWGSSTYFGSNETIPELFKGNWLYVGESGFQWSLFRYGDAVKYVIIEHDNGEVTETFKSLTTGFNAGFGQNGSEKDPNFFNISASFSLTSSVKVTSTNNSDNLAEFIMYYTDKVGFAKPDGPYSSGAMQIVGQTK